MVAPPEGDASITHCPSFSQIASTLLEITKAAVSSFLIENGQKIRGDEGLELFISFLKSFHVSIVIVHLESDLMGPQDCWLLTWANRVFHTMK